jgi:hypothetical protein
MTATIGGARGSRRMPPRGSLRVPNLKRRFSPELADRPRSRGATARRRTGGPPLQFA